MTPHADVAQRLTAIGGFGGTGGGVIFGLTHNEVAAYASLFVAVIAWITNVWISWYYKRKEDRRKNDEHAMMRCYYESLCDRRHQATAVDVERRTQ